MAEVASKPPHGTSGFLLFLGILLFYAVGPNNPRIFNAYPSDLVFAFYFLYLVVAGSRLPLFPTEARVFIWPAVIALFSHAGKVLSGFPLGVDEFANSIKSFQLYVIVIIGYHLAGKEVLAGRAEAMFRRCGTVASIGILFNAGIGILQYLDVGFVTSLIKSMYLVEQVQGGTNLDYFEGENRVVGIFESYNGLGYFLAISMFMVILMKRGKRSLPAEFALGAGALALLLTGNRASMIGLFLMTIIYYSFVVRSVMARVVVVASTSVVLVGVAALSSLEIMPRENIGRVFEFVDLVTQGTIPPTWEFRLESWSWMPAHIVTSPYYLFGYPKAVWLTSVFSWGADSQYVAWLLSYGLFGLVAFLVWWIAVISYHRRRWRAMRTGNTPGLAQLHGGFAVLWGVMLIIGISQDSMLANRSRELLMAILGALGALTAMSQQRPPSTVQQ